MLHTQSEYRYPTIHVDNLRVDILSRYVTNNKFKKIDNIYTQSTP